MPDIVVLHYTAMLDAQAALDRLCDPGVEVSAHYLISRRGEVFQLVEEAMRAWHAGAGAWGEVRDVNSRSIGIELDNTGAQPFAEPQMTALEDLLSGILDRWSIPPERVIAHSDLAPTRKSDPGTKFDWRRLALQGVSVWPADYPEVGTSRSGFQDCAETFGYAGDAGDAAVLHAFRLRFRPQAEGPEDATDIGMIRALARRHPVDRTRRGD